MAAPEHSAICVIAEVSTRPSKALLMDCDVEKTILPEK